MTSRLLVAGGHRPAATSRTGTRHYAIALKPGLTLLNANQRPHFHKRATITADIRGGAMEAATEHPQLMADLAAAKPGPLLARAHILGVLHPPTAGRRDPANWYPTFKAAVDGLVDAGLFEDDDHEHVLGPDMRLGDKVKGGQIVLHVTELAVGENWPELPAAVTR